MNRVKLLKAVLLLALAVFVVVVVANYRTGTTISDSTADEDLRKLVAGEQLIQTEFNQKSYEREKLKNEISARELVNYQDGVNILEDLHLSFGRDGMDVRSDFGRHDQESGDSFLWENVRINDGKGMTINTASALHDDTLGTLTGDRLVEFSDSRLSGSSMGVLYDMNSGELQLPAEVDLTIRPGEGGTGVPVRVKAGYLKLLRDQGVAYLAQGVVLEQGRLGLQSRTLRIDFDPESRRIRHVSAHGSVVFQMAEGPAVETRTAETTSGMQALGEDGSRKTLRASRLELFFPVETQEAARLSYIVARGTEALGAEIVLDPPPGENGQRRLEGRRLVFRFHPEGAPNRLDSFHAEGHCRLTMSGDRAEDIVLTGETLTARFDARQQEIEAAEISGTVEFSRGAEHIRGERANYDAPAGRLLVTGKENGALPRLWNDTVALEAVRILYGVDGQLLEAEENVWVSVSGESGEMGLDVALFSEASDNEPVFIHADRLESDLEAGVSSFSGTVRVLKGENVLATRMLWVYHQDRRMEALERVSLIIQPPGGTGGGEEAAAAGEAIGGITALVDPGEADGEAVDEYPPDTAYDRAAPLQITCRKLVYDDLGRYIILDDRVNVRQHRTRLDADHMEIQLGREDNRIEHIIASVLPAKETESGLTGTRTADVLMTGFDSQARRQASRTTMIAGGTDAMGTAETTGEKPGTAPPAGDTAETSAEGPPNATSRPVVPQVTVSQPGGRSASGERVLYYPESQIAVLVGLDTPASVVDPRSGSAQGTTLTYHLADGKILNRANDNEVTLVLLHSGASSEEAAGAGSGASNRGNRGGRAASTGASARGFGGRSASR